MGLDLYGAGGYFRWSGVGWANVLSLAQHYGWQGVGTGPPRGVLKSEWVEIYWGNQGQRFYARDAVALAAALERAVTQMPKRKPKKLGVTHYGSLSSEDGRRALRELVGFCRAGSFRIH